MKRVFIMMAVLLGFLSAANWTLKSREAASVVTTPWPKHQAQLAIIYQDEGGVILAMHDDWIEGDVVGTNLHGFVWTPVLEATPGDGTIVEGAVLTIGNLPAGAQGCGLCVAPLNDEKGVSTGGKPFAYLKPGTQFKVKGFTRPTWYLLDLNIAISKLRKEALVCKGWVYGPFGK